ncbi:hypothetical protein SCUCBS95973_002785 [Sporothrix curviconia]|uniref:HD/PDEase domain-containing protein n=1 Tax=Sporothrix curviconia TaxID=1260050 RepID=A0ABP0B9T2_9PEZI
MGSQAKQVSADPFSLAGDPLIESVTAAVRIHMSRYDGSHDFAHIRRVVGLARHLTRAYQEEQAETSSLVEEDTKPVNERVVALAALLHDVGDRKYLNAGGDAALSDDADEQAAITDLLRDTPYVDDPGARATAAVLHRCAAGRELARQVVLVCQNVSWSHENRTAASRAAVAELAARVPELAIVQDADRLDSIGGVGVARCFAYGSRAGVGSPNGRSLDQSLDHFDEKLVRVKDHMKTTEGRRLAVERTERLRMYQAWFRDEAAFAVGDALGSA